MIYVLIFSLYHGGVGTVEFNSLQECQAAAKSVAHSANKNGSTMDVLVCASKKVTK